MFGFKKPATPTCNIVQSPTVYLLGEAKKVDVFQVNAGTSYSGPYVVFATAEAAFNKYPHKPVTKREVWKMPDGSYIESPRVMRLRVQS